MVLPPPAPAALAKAASSASKSAMLTLVEMNDGPARCEMDDADERAPVVAALHRRQRALPVDTPDRVPDRFQADAVLVCRPALDLRVREGGRDGAEERTEPF
jgi:hypothetical protein